MHTQDYKSESILLVHPHIETQFQMLETNERTIKGI